MRARRMVIALMVPLLAACAAEGPGADKDFVYSYMDRYPLTSKAATRIDVSAGRPGSGETQLIQMFGRRFLQSGQGKIVIFVPQSGPAALSSGNWVKDALLMAGVPASRITWDARAMPPDARAMPPGIVRVAFADRGGQTPWNCTNLNEDVQQRADQTSYLNRELVNFGCAFQSNVRAQVENPGDFVQPRPETGIEPVRAANSVRQLRSKQPSPTVSPSSP